jgi:hypothetical protein
MQSVTPHTNRSNAHLARLGVVVAALMLTGGMIVNQSRAAFSTTTENPDNAFNAGTIALTDDDADTAMFNVGAMVPGDTATGCLTVSYTGSADPGAVKIYSNAYTESDGAADGASLDAALTFAIDVVDNCTAQAVVTPVHAGITLSAFAAAHSDYSNGLSAQWDPAATESRSYRFVATFTPSGSTATDNTRIGDTVSNLIFTWETQAGS